jgi:hypothetical protein
MDSGGTAVVEVKDSVGQIGTFHQNYQTAAAGNNNGNGNGYLPQQQQQYMATTIQSQMIDQGKYFQIYFQNIFF